MPPLAVDADRHREVISEQWFGDAAVDQLAYLLDGEALGQQRCGVLPAPRAGPGLRFPVWRSVVDHRLGELSRCGAGGRCTGGRAARVRRAVSAGSVAVVFGV